MSLKPASSSPSDLIKTRDELLSELQELRARNAVLEESEARAKHLETVMQAGEETTRQLLDQTLYGVWVNVGGKVAYINETGARILGASDPREIIGKSVFEVMHPDYHDRVRDRIHMMCDTGGAVPMIEEKVVRVDGGVVDVDIWAMKFIYEGKPAILVAFRDITERRRIAAALKESEERYRELVENANSIIIRWDIQGNLTFFNEFAEKLFGYSKDEVLGRNVVGTIVPLSESTGRDLAAMVEDILKYPERYKLNVNENVCKNGERVSIAWTNKAIYDDKGNVVEILSVGNDITERKRAEAALQESEERFRATFEQAAVGIAHVALDGHWLRFNQKLCEITGYTREELSGLTFQDITYPADLEADLKNVERLLAGEAQTYSMEKRYVKKDGSLVWINLTVSLLYKDGRPEHFISVIEDITERKRAEEALQFERLQLLSIFDSIDEVIYVADPYTHEILYANKAMQDKFGKHLIGGTCYREIQGRSAPCEFCTNDVILRNKNMPCRWEFHNPTVNRDFGIVDRIIKWPDGRYVRFEIALDITERKQAEEALRESEENSRAAFEQAAVGMTYVSMDGRILRVNQKFCDITGYTREELAGITVRDITYEPDMAEEARLVGRLLSGEIATFSKEKRYIRKDGAVVWVNLTVTPIFHKGAMAYLMGITEDITERKRAEENLRLTQFSIDRAADIALWVAPSGRFIYANEAACKAFGYTSEEFRSLKAFDTNPYFNEKNWGDHWKEVKERGSYTFEARLRRKDGTLFPGEITVNYLVYEGKEYNCSYIRDITERKLADEALREAKAQAELYVDLMGHDINNIHQSALGYLELARDMPGDAREEYLDMAMEALARSARLIGNVRKLQKIRDSRHAQDVDVCAVLGGVYDEYARSPGKTITLNLNGHTRCYVHADDLLHDVFSNLVGNAVKHTGNRAHVSISLDKVLEAGTEYYRVLVDDDGPGIRDELKKTLFSRSLKGTPRAKGMGLGLYIVKTLVGNYGGLVRVEDRVTGDYTKGARFAVMLPAVLK